MPDVPEPTDPLPPPPDEAEPPGRGHDQEGRRQLLRGPRAPPTRRREHSAFPLQPGQPDALPRAAEQDQIQIRGRHPRV